MSLNCSLWLELSTPIPEHFQSFQHELLAGLVGGRTSRRRLDEHKDSTIQAIQVTPVLLLLEQSHPCKMSGKHPELMMLMPSDKILKAIHMMNLISWQLHILTPWQFQAHSFLHLNSYFYILYNDYIYFYCMENLLYAPRKSHLLGTLHPLQDHRSWFCPKLTRSELQSYHSQWLGISALTTILFSRFWKGSCSFFQCAL